MKMFLAAITLFGSSAALAVDHCSRYENRPSYLAAIKAVATFNKFTNEELCANARILEIEAQPSHTVTVEGEVIPHVQLQLHFDYSSCLYMVRISDNVITSNRCYSGM
jgi:hypothetical protein